MRGNEMAALRCTGDAARETPDLPAKVDRDAPPRKSSPTPALVLGADLAAVAAEVERQGPPCYLCGAGALVGRLVLLDGGRIAGTMLCAPCIPRRHELHAEIRALVALLEAPGAVAA